MRAIDEAIKDNPSGRAKVSIGLEGSCEERAATLRAVYKELEAADYRPPAPNDFFEKEAVEAVLDPRSGRRNVDVKMRWNVHEPRVEPQLITKADLWCKTSQDEKVTSKD